WRGPGVAVEGVAEAETVLEAGCQGVRLECRGGRAWRGGPVAAVFDVVGAAIQGEHPAAVHINRRYRGVQLGRLTPDGPGGLLGVSLSRVDGGLLRVLVERGDDLQAATADLGRVKPGRAEFTLDHFEQEAFGTA